MKDLQILEKYINLLENQNYDFLSDNEFTSFIYDYDIYKHPPEVNSKFMVLLRLYLKSEYKIYISSMLEFISENDDLILIPTFEEILRDAKTHVRCIESSVFKKPLD